MCFRTPFIDRFAYAWMWHHAGWDIAPPVEPGPDGSGSKEPLALKPSPPALNLTRELNED